MDYFLVWAGGVFTEAADLSVTAAVTGAVAGAVTLALVFAGIILVPDLAADFGAMSVAGAPFFV